jgi:lambda family phage portal protein
MKKNTREYKLSAGDRIGEAFDRFVGIFSPEKAMKRQFFRRSMMAASSYRSADSKRIRGSWIPGGGSADADLLPNLSILRERSRDLNRNDPHASGITSTVTINSIGTGIRPQSRVDHKYIGIEESKAVEFQRAAERAWRKWVPVADAGQRLDFYAMQALIDRQILENGEAIIIPVAIKRSFTPYLLALQCIEADRLGTPSDKRGDKNIRDGVEIGQYGEPVAYYIRKTHPGDWQYNKYNSDSAQYVRYPARNELGRLNVIHLYEVKRPGQTRGEPFFAAVMNYFKDKAEYMEAELVTAKVAACFSAVVKKTDPLGAAMVGRTTVGADNKRLETLEPGTFEYLQPGEDITQINPARQGNTFEPFIETILRAISAGLNLPYEVVAKDFSRTNYSSARAALLEARRYFRTRQEFMGRRFCQPVWEMQVEEAYLMGELPILDFYKNRSDYTTARWISPGWGWVDPTKEVDAARSAVEGHLSTLADETAALGYDWEETLEQLAREEKKKKELGLESKPLAKSGSKDPNNQEKEEPVPARQRPAPKTEEILL